MHAKSRSDWQVYDAAQIPTKTQMPHLESWLSKLALPVCVLDVGCGTGAASRLALDHGCAVVGIDINAAAIQGLMHRFRDIQKAAFHIGDVASPKGFGLGKERFGGAICQLVASVVGDADDRAQLLKNIYEALLPGAKLSISFSGLSSDINLAYAELYEADLPLTGEFGTYFSRDENGNMLYQTHHFEEPEIRKLLTQQSFYEIQIEEKIETSSRRSDQRARFYYVSCQRAASP